MRWIGLLLLGLSAYGAQDTFVVDGQYRGRMDIYNGVNKATYGDASIDAKGKTRGESDDRIYLQQVIAGLTYRPASEWEYKLYFYDSRAWGSSLETRDFIVNVGTADQYVMDYYDDHHELYTAYVRRYNAFTDGLTLTLGRQKLGYGDRRVFGPGEWGNTMGWLWDAVHASYRFEKNFIDAWYGQTRTKEPDDFSLIEKHRYQGIGIYGHYEMSGMAIEPFFAWKNPLYHTVLPYENFYYAGGRFYRDGAGWNWDVTGVREWGESGSKTVDAYGYVLKGGYRWENSLKPRITVGYTYASGDDDRTDDRSGTFTTPFGMTDGPLYGRMDIMAWSNLRDAEASVQLTLTPEWTIETGIHRFHLAEANDKWVDFGYTNRPGNHYTHLGDECDLIVGYRLGPAVNLLGIASYFRAGDFIRNNGIAQNDASKIFLQLEYRFSSRD